MYTSDIFITENWTGRELRSLKLLICIKIIFLISKMAEERFLCTKCFVQKSDIDIVLHVNIFGEYQWHTSLSRICFFRANYIPVVF